MDNVYRCSDSGLEALDDTKLTDKLQELECDHNLALDALSPKLGACTNLEKLLANHCSIAAIPIELCGAASRSLVSINLSFNKITELPYELGEMSALVDVDFSSNLLTTVSDDVLFGLSSVQFLYLSDNRLTTMGSVATCTRLRELLLNVRARPRSA